MTLRATQVIASAFGTYRPGDEVSAEAAGPVLQAWLAAGIVVDEPAVEATALAPPETATAPRQRGRPQRRFVEQVDSA